MFLIQKQNGELVYHAIVDGKKVGWETRKAAEHQRQTLELYYMWGFDAVVVEVPDA